MLDHGTIWKQFNAPLHARLCSFSQEVTNSLQSEEDKANRLGKIKIRLEASLQEVSRCVLSVCMCVCVCVCLSACVCVCVRACTYL